MIAFTPRIIAPYFQLFLTTHVRFTPDMVRLMLAIRECCWCVTWWMNRRSEWMKLFLPLPTSHSSSGGRTTFRWGGFTWGKNKRYWSIVIVSSWKIWIQLSVISFLIYDALQEITKISIFEMNNKLYKYVLNSTLSYWQLIVNINFLLL